MRLAPVKAALPATLQAGDVQHRRRPQPLDGAPIAAARAFILAP